MMDWNVMKNDHIEYSSELTGKKFGRLLILHYIKVTHNNKSRIKYFCMCECGTKKYIDRCSIIRGKSKSCGCLRRETTSNSMKDHGMTGSHEHKTWMSMINRCNNKVGENYKNYGARGIIVCERWLESFTNFYNDLGDRPSSKHSIERIDVNGDYTPTNCVWIENTKQRRNNRKQRNNTSGVTGVYRDKCRFCAEWRTIDGKTKTKSFSIKKYGEELAFLAACEARELAIENLNRQGAGYGYTHGK